MFFAIRWRNIRIVCSDVWMISRKKRLKQRDKWITKLESLVDMANNNEEAKESLKSIRGIIEQLYSL